MGENNGVRPLSHILMNKNGILLDIEGTTTSINFVRDILFTRARKEVKNFLLTKYEDEEIAPLIENFKEQVKKDLTDKVDGATPLPDDVGPNPSKQEMVTWLHNNFLAMMDADRKVGPLKALQGCIWEQGYRDGSIKGHIYDDVIPALKLWKAEGKEISIYSSGSVSAQKLLFGHTVEGDILHFFSNYFDTKIGLKNESGSYDRIVKELKMKPQQILFITDNEKEAFAASEAGLDVVISIRPGNAPLSSACQKQFLTITSFMDFYESPKDGLTTCNKRDVSQVDTS